MRKLAALFLALILMLNLSACFFPTFQSVQDSFSPLTAGCFVVSSVSVDGDITFYNTLDPDNGYIELYEDGTGVFFWENTTRSITWDHDSISLGDGERCLATYLPPEKTGDTTAMMGVFLLDEGISLVLRPAEHSDDAP